MIAPHIPPRVQCWLGPALVSIAALAGLYWSWGTWPDVVIDFGRELYVPWRLATGQVLYRDIAYFNGPLSPYLNSLLFRVFGTSLQTLVIANCVTGGLVLVLLYRIFRQIGGQGSALLACLVFLTMFAFTQMEMFGNSNWICPYSHEMTHGLALSLASVYLLWMYARGERVIWAGASGFVLGLVFLTKGELFAAAAVANAATLCLSLWLEPGDQRRTVRVVGTWVFMMLVPVLLAFGLLATAMPARDALTGTLGLWAHVFNWELTGLLFYRQGMGVNDLASSIIQLFRWTVWYVLLTGLAAGAALACRWPGRTSWIITTALFTTVGTVLGLLWNQIAWRQMARPWPLFMLVMAVATAVSLRRYKHHPEIRQNLLLRLAMIVLGLALLAKMILNARIMQYGFVLAMPATLLLVAALWDWLPALIDRRGGQARIFRGAALAGLLLAASAHWQISTGYFSQKRIPVASGADRFVAGPRGLLIQIALDEISRRVQPGQTMAVLPEGAMLNFLARIPTSTRDIQFIPPEMKMFGENRMLEALKRHQPDWIVLVHRDDSEYGSPFFGRDYGQKLAAWIAAHYQDAKQIGAPPFCDQFFGILVKQRTDLP